MLLSQTVAPATLALLKDLCKELLFQTFALGGGTNIALQKGHRISVDLDFFTNQSFTNAHIYKYISSLEGETELLFEQNQTMMFIINLDDIIPMKLQAISNRFAKKDFYDIDTLLTDYSLQKMMDIFKRKFPDIDIGFLVHSLTHFEIADEEDDPILLPASKPWEQVKSNLQRVVKDYVNQFL